MINRRFGRVVVREVTEPLFPRVANAAAAARGDHPNKRRSLVAPHSIQRQGDECYCARCDRRWDVNESAPSACAPNWTKRGE